VSFFPRAVQLPDDPGTRLDRPLDGRVRDCFRQPLLAVVANEPAQKRPALRSMSPAPISSLRPADHTNSFGKGPLARSFGHSSSGSR
jgi:hypothetical protein